jgi:hypothetical protein
MAIFICRSFVFYAFANEFIAQKTKNVQKMIFFYGKSIFFQKKDASLHCKSKKKIDKFILSI